MTVATGTVTLTIIYEGLLLYSPADNVEKVTASKIYLSNRPQVSLVYRLINHAGCWQNTTRICKSRAAKHKNLWSIAFI